MNCEFCKSPVHIWFQCPKKPDGWKPARLAKEKPRPVNGMGRPHAAGLIPVEAVKSSGSLVALGSSGKAGSIPARVNEGSTPSPDAPNSKSDPHSSMPRDKDAATSGSTSAGMVGNEDRQPKFDKKAWMRDYMKTYMRKRRAAQKENGSET